MNKDITTTCGERFTEANSRELARLVFVRFGRDSAAALAAWHRLLQNNCGLEQFFDLIGRDWLNMK
jgi:hypothetical protein